MNEKGAILPSIIVFVLLLVVILLGSVNIYHNQMHQLFATKETYNAKAMLMVTEQELTAKLDNSEMIETGTATFQNGEVHIKKTASNHYQLTAVTNKEFSLTKQIIYSMLESSEVSEGASSSKEAQANQKESVQSDVQINPLSEIENSQGN
ncbi:hypothetical protein JTF06_00455 [Desemzia sp. RIT804]|uniref:hypothetical protein n=1 Tax=Desemzia sp. RIT 804 TaxID=2810209 RepID=UPI00194ED402|nr:hypothetical protein [Desemzia sp. RIT 804]MBM6613358.1 hypothetical protein [Desemzia sp. RIT 804]